MLHLYRIGLGTPEHIALLCCRISYHSRSIPHYQPLDLCIPYNRCSRQYCIVRWTGRHIFDLQRMENLLLLFVVDRMLLASGRRISVHCEDDGEDSCLYWLVYRSDRCMSVGRRVLCLGKLHSFYQCKSVRSKFL